MLRIGVLWLAEAATCLHNRHLVLAKSEADIVFVGALGEEAGAGHSYYTVLLAELHAECVVLGQHAALVLVVFVLHLDRRDVGKHEEACVGNPQIELVLAVDELLKQELSPSDQPVSVLPQV